MRRAGPERWLGLCKRLGVASPAHAGYDSIARCYAEPQRAYHTLQHIEECLAEFDAVRGQTIRAHEAEAALWLHDVVYDPRAEDNEERSAEWARRALGQAGVRDEVVGRIAGLIVATRHTSPPDDPDACFVVDIDLAILGQAPERFDEYERQIRQEYAWTPEGEFRSARARILRAFQARPHLYQTEFFRACYEARARENLKRSQKRLGLE
jgi:predicted metal-dependent HD superfamily phosphohydrolase